MLKEGSAIARVNSVLDTLTIWLAGFGGVVLAAVALMTFVSIIGRELISFGLGPIRGDFELVEVGAAIAVFSFLPYCQMRRGHMTVDLVIAPMSTRIFNLTSLLGDIAISAFSVLIAWRLWLGLWEKVAYNESTMILGMPIWYGFALSMVGAVLFACASLFSIWKDIHLMARGIRIS